MRHYRVNKVSKPGGVVLKKGTRSPRQIRTPYNKPRRAKTAQSARSSKTASKSIDRLTAVDCLTLPIVLFTSAPMASKHVLELPDKCRSQRLNVFSIDQLIGCPEVVRAVVFSCLCIGYP